MKTMKGLNQAVGIQSCEIFNGVRLGKGRQVHISALYMYAWSSVATYSTCKALIARVGNTLLQWLLTGGVNKRPPKKIAFFQATHMIV